MRISWKKILGLVLSAVLVAVSFTTKIGARDAIDTTKTGSITMSYPVSGISFRLYQVGIVADFGTYTPTSDFSSYAVKLEAETQSDWKEIADTLSGYILRDDITPVKEVTSDESGNVVFSDLALGLYLIDWDSHESDGKRYTSQASLVSVPTLNSEEWVYDVVGKLKYGVEDIPEGTISRRVHKVWDDNKNEAGKQPASITVDLLKDGEVYETVVLNESNSWSYEWETLSARSDWDVVEKEVPTDYTVTTSMEGHTFVIRNTYTPPETPTPTPTPDTPTTPTPTPETPDIPQTGQLWWPVPFLAGIGMCFFLVGFIRSRHAR